MRVLLKWSAFFCSFCISPAVIAWYIIRALNAALEPACVSDYFSLAAESRSRILLPGCGAPPIAENIRDWKDLWMGGLVETNQRNG